MQSSVVFSIRGSGYEISRENLGEERRKRAEEKVGVGFPAVGPQRGKVTFGYCYKYENAGVSAKYRYMSYDSRRDTRWR